MHACWYKMLGIEDSRSWLLALTYAQEDNWEEALRFAERLTHVSPSPQSIGTLAGVLKRTGQVNRAEELIQKLMPGDSYGAPMAIALYYFVCGEMDRAAEWWEKVIEQRHPLAPFMVPYFCIQLPVGLHWPN